MPELAHIKAGDLATALPRVLPMLEGLAKDSQGRFEPLDYARGILTNMMQLWMATEGEQVIGIMLSEIVGYPHRREANLFAATGFNADRWIALMPIVEAWARSEGCFLLKATCRPGWEPLLKPIGFSKGHVVLEKVL